MRRGFEIREKRLPKDDELHVISPFCNVLSPLDLLTAYIAICEVYTVYCKTLSFVHKYIVVCCKKKMSKCTLRNEICRHFVSKLVIFLEIVKSKCVIVTKFRRRKITCHARDYNNTARHLTSLRLHIHSYQKLYYCRKWGSKLPLNKFSKVIFSRIPKRLCFESHVMGLWFTLVTGLISLMSRPY